ncbi:hypothetical protein [Acidimangrovimonas pyrenivorans]|uniref:Uncharacterized protein n=1 Tax=Acidimangrovimonas pyrenivorans TaxID=2030798 RepID=A0ABV7AJS6_9RHOB
MTQSDEEKARILWHSAKNVFASYKHLDALYGAVDENFCEISFKHDGDNFTGDQSNCPKDGHFDSDWVNLVWSSHANLRAQKKKGRPKLVGTVSAHLMLADGGDADLAPDWTWRGQPCLIAGWHEEGSRMASEWDDGGYWTVDWFDPTDEDSTGHISAGGKCIWRYKDEMGLDLKTGFFVVPIFDLTSEEDLEKHVFKPLIRLFQGASEDDAFPEDSPAVRTAK